MHNFIVEAPAPAPQICVLQRMLMAIRSALGWCNLHN